MTTKRKYTFWPPEAVERLRILLGSRPNEEVARILGRDVSAVMAKAHRLGIRRADLHQGYMTRNQASLHYGLTWQSLRSAIRIAHPHYEIIGLFGPMKLYERDALDRAVELWHSLETLHEAAERTGWHEHTLLTWFAQDDVRVYRLRASRGAHRLVKRSDVDTTVAKHQEFETLDSACRRHQLSRPTMSRLLMNAGVIPSKLRSKAHLDPKAVDEVVNARSATESTTQASKRLGIHSWTLNDAVIKAGYPSPGRRRTRRLPPSVYDQIAAPILEKMARVQSDEKAA